MKKKIILSLPYGMSIRDLASQDFLKVLSDKYDIFLFSTIFNDPKSKKYFKNFKNIHHLNYKKNNFLEIILISIISNLKTIKFIKKNRTLSFTTMMKSLKNGNSNVVFEGSYKQLNSKILNFIVSLSLLYYPIIYISKFLLFLSSLKYFNLFFNKKISLFFTSHPYCNLDYPLEYCARLFGCKTIAMIHSWDNITTKMMMHFKYKKIYVWNKVMSNQLKKFYKYKSKNLYVTGIPQFDDYEISNNFLSKKKLDKIIKFKKKRIVTCFCGCPDITPNFENIILSMSKLFEDTKLSNNYKFVVRCHPGYDYSWTKKIQKYENTFVNIPGNLAVPMEVEKLNKVEEERQFLCSILKHSDIILNFFSTTALDAVYFDKPVIGICIDGNSDENLPGSQLSYYYQWDHYKNLMKTKGIDLCKNIEQLPKLIKKAENLNYKKLGRKKIFDTQIIYKDGCSRKRIAKDLIKD